MDPRELLREQFMEIIDNQIQNNDPPETKQTLDRLMNDGYNEEDAKLLIGQCVSVEIFNVLSSDESFNEERYVKNLHKLPEEPEE